MNASTPPTKQSRSPVQAIVGLALGVVALAVLVGGALFLSVANNRDADGFYATGTHRLTTPTHALVSERLDLGNEGPDWLFRNGRLGTIRVTAKGDAGKAAFIGVARASQVDTYLRGVAVDEIVDFGVDPFSVTTARHAGSATPRKPTDQTFWAKIATGSGKQTLTWQVEKGTWAVVVMNADASPGVRTDVTIGAKVPVLYGAAIGVLVVGGALAVIAGAVLYSGIRRRVRTPESVPVTATVGGAR